MSEILYKEESYAIIGAAMKVHQILGHGFTEAVYHEALIREFQKQNIPYETKKRLKVFYDGEFLNKYFEADLICYDHIILELKAVSYLNAAHKAQVLNYLKITNLKLGILINFGSHSLESKRIIL